MSALALDVVRAERDACAARLALLDAAVSALEALEPDRAVGASREETKARPEPTPVKPAKTTPPPSRNGHAVTDTAGKRKKQMPPAGAYGDVRENVERVAALYAEACEANITARVPFIAERMGVPRTAVANWLATARKEGLVTSPAPVPPSLVREPPPTNGDARVADAKAMHARAIEKRHSDPIGFVVDNLGITRSKAKELLGIPAGQR